MISTRHISLSNNVNESAKAVRMELNNTKLRQPVINCQPMPRKIPKELISQLHRGGNLKSRMIKNSSTVCVCVCVCECVRD
jgi:hypothetical protein